ncbi:endo- -beta-xylanase precursor [Moniliophthora roreri MCA 2997]|uniref:Endo--beta-xylanase n=2 Tax=Moniliophthora roreri TaxID=221103 RepID=V2WRE7_MONRO|nr:endo- -beta-xylanase precursor [Moniliophthora roreri MCA 2997]
MSDQPYKTFAIVGASGYIGSYILNAFISRGIHPLILSRVSSSYVPPEPFAKVDFNNVDAVPDILSQHHIDVLISVVGTEALDSQRSLADAAKKGGVKLFVASEFGFVSEGIHGLDSEDQTTPHACKDRVVDYLRQIGLPYTRFFVAAFVKWANWLTGVDENGKVNIVGEGETPMGWTHEDDIGGFVAYTLSTLSPAQLHNRSFRIEGDSLSLVDLAKRMNKEVAYVDQIPGGPFNEVKNQLGRLAESGKGSSKWDYALGAPRAKLDNGMWEGHIWKKMGDSV